MTCWCREWTRTYQPDYLLCGHIHQGPFVPLGPDLPSRFGRALGVTLGVVQGAIEVAGGSTLTGAGVLAEVPSAGLSTPVVIGGAATAVHGSYVLGNAANAIRNNRVDEGATGGGSASEGGGSASEGGDPSGQSAREASGQSASAAKDSTVTAEELAGKTRTEVRDLAKQKELKQAGDPAHPDFPRKWKDPVTGEERLRLDRGHVDPKTGQPYKNPNAAVDHVHGYEPGGAKIKVDNDPHIPTTGE